MHNIADVAFSSQRSTILGAGSDITILFCFLPFQNQCQSLNHVHIFLPISIVIPPKPPLHLYYISLGGALCADILFIQLFFVLRGTHIFGE